MDYNYGICYLQAEVHVDALPFGVALLLIIPHPHSFCIKAPHRSYAIYYTSLAYISLGKNCYTTLVQANRCQIDSGEYIRTSMILKYELRQVAFVYALVAVGA